MDKFDIVAWARALTRKLDEMSCTCARPRPRYALGRSACRGCMAADYTVRSDMPRRSKRRIAPPRRQQRWSLPDRGAKGQIGE